MDKKAIIKVIPDKAMDLSGHPAFYFVTYSPEKQNTCTLIHFIVETDGSRRMKLDMSISR